MMMDALTEKIGKSLAAKLDGFKFVKSKWCLVKEVENGWQAIVIEALPTSQPGVVKLAAHAHLRIDALEKAYTPYNPFLTPKDAKIHPTLVKNCDGLIGDKALANGFSTDDKSVGQFIENYSIALKNDVLPWLEKYSDEQNLLDGLIHDDLAQRATSDPLTIYPVALTIFAKRSEWDAFDRLADEFVSYCEKPHAQVYKPLADSVIAGLKVI